MKMASKYDIEDRLIEFAILCVGITEMLPKTAFGLYLEGQLIRSATGSALIYGEAQAAESRKDFIHKMKMTLKELRESNINLKLIQRKPLLSSSELNAALAEANELISIFVKSIQTTYKNMNNS
jgi:four helix bundle protein